MVAAAAIRDARTTNGTAIRCIGNCQLIEVNKVKSSALKKQEYPSDFDAMGKPVPTHRRANAYEWLKSIGVKSEDAWECVGGMAEQLERDKPYEAMERGRQHVDLTGAYRLMAYLLSG